MNVKYILRCSLTWPDRFFAQGIIACSIRARTFYKRPARKKRSGYMRLNVGKTVRKQTSTISKFPVFQQHS